MAEERDQQDSASAKEAHDLIDPLLLRTEDQEQAAETESPRRRRRHRVQPANAETRNEVLQVENG